MKGKNFSLNSTKRNKNDYYQTPYSMTRFTIDRDLNASINILNVGLNQIVATDTTAGTTLKN